MRFPASQRSFWKTTASFAKEAASLYFEPVSNPVAFGHSLTIRFLRRESRRARSRADFRYAELITILSGVMFLALVVLSFTNGEILPAQRSIVRFLASLSAGVMANTVPGFLSVQHTLRSKLLRAGGASAVFILTYIFWPLTP
jgi:hypothetical protein